MAPNGLLAVVMVVLCCTLADQQLVSDDIPTDTTAPESTESTKGEIFIKTFKQNVWFWSQFCIDTFVTTFD